MNHHFYTKDKTKVLLRKLEPKDAEIVLEYLQIVGGETDFLLFDETGLGVDLEQEDDATRHHNGVNRCCAIGF
mgnify:CR=1 FL=1